MSETQSSEIWINKDFTASNVASVREQILKASKDNQKIPIIVYINSYGGSVDCLNLLIDTFDSVPNEIITVCAGTAMSAGAVLLSCGNKRYISKNSRVMIHKVSSMSWGNVDDIKNDTDETLRLNQQLLNVISKNTKKTVKQIEKLLKDKRDLYLTAEEAVKFGIADEIGLPFLKQEISYKIVVE